MKKLTTIFAALFLCLGMAQAQDVYYSGNSKIWKNDSLLYNLTDSISIQLKAIQVTDSGAVYGAGYAFDTAGIQGRIWMNDSCVFTGDTNTYFDHLALTANGWTAAGFNNVWQNGELLYSYSHGEDECHIQGLAVDTTTGDIYAGGAISFVSDSLFHACVWKNDSLLWMEDTVSSIQNICFGGGNIYAAGFMIENDSLYGVIWQNDSIIYQMENANFGHIAEFNGSLYWSGLSMTDTVFYIWQDGEVLYALPELSGISNLVVNEDGVYYTDAQTVYKDGEVLYQPGCIITDLVVIPTSPEPPVPMGTLTVTVNDTLMGSVIGEGTYPLGDTVTIEAFPNTGYTFLYWHDSITDNPRDILFTQDTTFTAYFGLAEYTITTAVNPEGTGTVTEGGIYHYGDTITLVAVADSSYLFLRWDDGNTDNPRDVIVTQSATFIAYFVNAECTIETLVTPEGTGTVTGAGTYPYGDTIVLIATPITGYEFISWNDGNTENPRTLVVTENQTYTAQFDIIQHVVTTVVTPEGSGTVEGGGIYPYGETVTLTAQNNTGYIFKMWSDEVFDNPRQVVVDRDTTYTAVFSPLQYTITTGSDPEEGGVVEGGGSYPYGEPVTLTARPANNYSFLCWQDGITSNPRNIIVTGDATYKALFRFTGTVEYHIKLIPSDASMGTVEGEGQYPAGSVIEIKAVPFEHAQFVGWDDGNTDNPRTLVVNSDMILTAIFEPRPMYTITVTSISNTMGTVFGGGTFYANTEINIGAIPYEGFHFAGWQDGEMSNPRTITVTEDAEYIANFSQTLPTTYTVTVHYLPEQGYILGAGSYIEGTTATLVAIAKEGYVFAQWSDGITDETREILVDHDIELSAFFSFTDVEENDAISLCLYPNPASDVIRIEGTEGIHDICIFNLMGQVVKTATIQDNEEIHIDDLPAGLYLIRIDSLHAIRFIKENK